MKNFEIFRTLPSELISITSTSRTTSFPLFFFLCSSPSVSLFLFPKGDDDDDVNVPGSSTNDDVNVVDVVGSFTDGDADDCLVTASFAGPAAGEDDIAGDNLVEELPETNRDKCSRFFFSFFLVKAG